MHRIGGNALFGRLGQRRLQYLLRAFLAVGLVLGAVHVAHAPAQGVVHADGPRLGNGHDIDLGFEVLGQLQALGQALVGQLGPVGGNQDALVHGGAP
ncbi:hypothetical protein G6F54_014404 [Rhizopus delemar]|nr:hypothetical protein G6F54_014404 [Rhizopus delemar]